MSGIGKGCKGFLAECNDLWEFLGGPVVKTPCFQCQGTGLIPGQGTKIPLANVTYRKSVVNSILSSKNWYEKPGTNPGLVYSRQWGNVTGRE